MLRLILLSLLNRRTTALLSILGIAVSVSLLLGVEKLRVSARDSFASTISGTDLIVGARAGDIQLLLYAVFRIGDATNNIGWDSYQEIAARPEIDWIVPLSLGDSHRGFRVVGTEAAFFSHYRYRQDKGLEFTAGGPFSDMFDAVIGAEVAAALGYKQGSMITLTHGTGELTGADHDNLPFRISGILKPTGTPVDRAIHVGLPAIEAIHLDWRSGSRIPGLSITEEKVRAMTPASLQPRAITAALVGLKSPIQTFRFQRYVNGYRAEPLTAILPGVALSRLWALIGIGERALAAVAILVVLTALLGLVTTIYATLNERRREMAILRANGASPYHIVLLLVTESAILTFSGAVLGTLILYGLILMLSAAFEAGFGLQLTPTPPSAREWLFFLLVQGAGLLAGLIPALRAYRHSLADGMTIRS
ncbi:MAG TPA: peptide ABC transporter permease [Alphaproteobacteria bacterium]|nr:peptide ABC transporter permease [Alphaproteobacteria bacterium]